MPENHGGHSTDPDTLVSIMKAIDSRIRAIVDWGNFRVENQAQRIESTRKLLPYAGLISAKVDRFDAEYRPGYDVAELVRLVEGSGYRGKYSIEITNPPADIVRDRGHAAGMRMRPSNHALVIRYLPSIL